MIETLLKSNVFCFFLHPHLVSEKKRDKLGWILKSKPIFTVLTQPKTDSVPVSVISKPSSRFTPISIIPSDLHPAPVSHFLTPFYPHHSVWYQAFLTLLHLRRRWRVETASSAGFKKHNVQVQVQKEDYVGERGVEDSRCVLRLKVVNLHFRISENILG